MKPRGSGLHSMPGKTTYSTRPIKADAKTLLPDSILPEKAVRKADELYETESEDANSEGEIME